MNDFTYKIVDHIADIAKKGSWTLELNRVSWSGRPATFDLRKWSEDHTKMSKGLSLSAEELAALGKVLASIEA